MANSIINDSLEGFVNKTSSFLKESTKIDLKTAYDKFWLVRRYINKSANDAVKKGRNIYFDNFTEEEKKIFFALEKELKIAKLSKAIIANVLLFGEVYVFADCANNKYNEDLDLENEEISEFVVFARDEINKTEEGYKITINNKSLVLHKSRVLRIASDLFQSFKDRNKKIVSDVEVALKDIIAYSKICDDMNSLAREKKVDVYEIDGLSEQLMTNVGEEKVFKWVSLVNELKSVNNALMVDKKDGYSVKEINLSGASDLWKTSAINVCGALNRPLTVLFGESASGFSTGEEDNKSYYEAIEELQNYLREFNEFADVFILAKMGKKGEVLDFDYASIDGINAKEQAEMFNLEANALNTLVEQGIINIKTAQLELRDKGYIKNITDKDIEESEKLDEVLIDYEEE